MEVVKESKQIKEECCPVFHPEKWEGKTFEWNQKPFIRASVPTLFHIPLPPMIGAKVTKMVKLAEDAHKLVEDKEQVLLLFHDPSAFKSEMFLSVTGPISNSNNTTLSGTFETRVFDAPFKAIPKLMKQIDQDLAQQGKKVKDYYVHYAYCPKCAKEQGHNYMVFFAELG
ncbi:hydrolase [Flagellimonas allohymeniacidonis]|uniref:Uncharacterized protein n=1 Tax=Flagellimonas allohymeniacidonis TaxID=2517819 RepID=A0A4Q8QJC3_9FLAO|nr:hydrolase [Allomuricauda hymeniacidonis]TAI48833.1 hypothetical protein EW142_03270 [Allomuricauda hymeniacidonis]